MRGSRPSLRGSLRGGAGCRATSSRGLSLSSSPTPEDPVSLPLDDELAVALKRLSALPLGAVLTQSVRWLEAAGDFPPDGLDDHVCFGTDGNLKVSEIWDSENQLQAFGDVLMPVLADIGIEPGEPEIIPIHNIVRR